MPADALPQPWPTALPGTVRYRREWRDALGRPMVGSASITGSRGAAAGGLSVPGGTPINVELVGGVLDVALPPDEYRLVAALRTVDGSGRTTVRETFELTAS